MSSHNGRALKGAGRWGLWTQKQLATFSNIPEFVAEVVGQLRSHAGRLEVPLWSQSLHSSLQTRVRAAIVFF